MYSGPADTTYSLIIPEIASLGECTYPTSSRSVPLSRAKHMPVALLDPLKIMSDEACLVVQACVHENVFMSCRLCKSGHNTVIDKQNPVSVLSSRHTRGDRCGICGW